MIFDFLKHAIDLAEKVGQQLVSITELVRHTLVADVPMLVVIRQPNPSVLELLRWLDGMSVVIAQNPLAVWFMQG